jgi:hypothetical protein
MQDRLKRAVAIGSVTALAALGLGLPVGAWAGGYCPPPPPPADDGKCNAGNGNGSDVVTFVEGAHCFGGDPGNSFNAGNRGGDEIPTTVGAGGVPNPGGNNNPG